MTEDIKLQSKAKSGFFVSLKSKQKQMINLKK